MTPEG